MAEATKKKSQQFLAAQKQAQAEFGVQGPLLSMKARPAPPKAPIEDTAKMVSPPTLKPEMYEGAIRRLNDRLAKPKAYDYDEKGEYFSNDKPIIRRPEDRYYNEYAQNEQTGQINREKQFSRQQKSNRLLAAQQQAQAEFGVQAPAMTQKPVAAQPTAPNKSPNTFSERMKYYGSSLPDTGEQPPLDYSNSSRSSGWMGDDSPAKNRIDQDVKNYQRQRDRNDMTSTQLKMVNNPVNPIDSSNGPTTSRIAWAQARLNERMGDTTPEQRRAAFDKNYPEAAENLKIGRENARQAKARKDDDILMFRLEKRGLGNSSQGRAIQKRINDRNTEFSLDGLNAEAGKIEALVTATAQAPSGGKPGLNLEAAKIQGALAKQRYLEANQWKLNNPTGRRELIPVTPPSKRSSPFSMDTERIRADLDAQNSRQRNEEYQNFKKIVGPLPVQSPAADAFAAQQVLENMYQSKRDLQQDIDNEYRNATPPRGYTGDKNTYNGTKAKQGDLWDISGPSTGDSRVRLLPSRLLPVNPNSQAPEERQAWQQGKRKMWIPDS